MLKRVLIWSTMALALGLPAMAAGPGKQKVQADLIAPTTAIVPGQPFQVGLRQIITPNWHTYWKNPGDSGEPTKIEWQLPKGFAASPIKWPIPNALPVGPLMNYGYSDTLLLPITITPPKTLDAQAVTLKAKARWLVCEKICIPESATVSLKLAVATPVNQPTASAHAGLFEAVERQLPIDMAWPAGVRLQRDELVLSIKAGRLDRNRITGVRFFPEKWGFVQHAAPQPITWSPNGFSIAMKPGDLVSGSLNTLSGVLVVSEKIEGKVVRNGFSLTATSGNAEAFAAVSSIAGMPSFWQAIAFAFIGGLILNLMPCVLPILSLKVISLSDHSAERGQEARRTARAYLAGVLTSFAVLAALLIGLRAAGETLGWGFQFQSPTFVLVMAALFFALGLSLSGVFEIGGSAIGLGASLTRQSASTGSFFTGVLATIAATPCTAPFMGVAVGYALTQPALELSLILMSLGLGFALPVVLLAFSGAAARILPKPGPWMQTLKQVLAFLLYGSVVWLVWVLSIQAGSQGVLAAGIVLLAVGFGAWLFGQQPSVTTRFKATIAASIVTAALIAGLSFIDPAPPGASNGASDNRDLASTYSPERVAKLRAEGRPVFVNFTAAWCISCKVNERLALDTDGFRTALTRSNTVYLKADWTNKNDKIARILKSFGRAGVPLYLLYPADRNAKPIVLPQLLTEAIVVRHLASLSRTKTGPSL